MNVIRKLVIAALATFVALAPPHQEIAASTHFAASASRARAAAICTSSAPA